jgi:hypothetical protein
MSPFDILKLQDAPNPLFEASKVIWAYRSWDSPSTTTALERSPTYQDRQDASSSAMASEEDRR